MTGNKKPGLEKSLKELEEVLTYFESEEFDLTEGIKRYDDAISLIGSIAGEVKGLKLHVENKRAELERILISGDY